MTKSCILTIGLLLTAAAVPAQVEVPLLDYACSVPGCLVYSPGTGYFSSGITVTGWYVRPGSDPWVRQAYTGLASQGCTVTISIDSIGHSYWDPLYYDGIVAETTAIQGLPKLKWTQERYFSAVFNIYVPNTGGGPVPCT